MNNENEVVTLYLDDIIPNRFQPREVFDDRALQELAASIKEHGVIQPIIVRKIGEKYEIIAGERRYKASALAGLTTIPAIVRNLDDKESSKVALLENLQRRDLSPIEEARTYQKILELDQLTQEELARTMGKSQGAIANKLRLLTLPDEVQDALLNDQISERHARSLLNIPDQKKQTDLLKKVIETKMTVRELDAEIKAMNEADSSSAESPQKTRFLPSDSDYSNMPTSTMPIDLEAMRHNAKDIIQEEKPMADLDSLLRLKSAPSNKEEVTPAEQNYKFVPTEEPVKEMPPLVDGLPSTKPSFFNIPTPVVTSAKGQEPQSEKSPALEEINISKEEILQPIDTIETLDFDIDFPDFKDLKIDDNISEKQTIDELKIEETPKTESITNPSKIRIAIEKVRSLTKELDDLGFKVDSEEMDLETAYQINLKITK